MSLPIVRLAKGTLWLLVVPATMLACNLSVGLFWSAVAMVNIAFIALFGDQPERVAAATLSWQFLLDLSLIAAYLGLIALIGLYARQIEETGGLGLIALVLASFGTMTNSGFFWAGGFVLPALTSAAPEFLDQVASDPPAIVAVGFSQQHF